MPADLWQWRHRQRVSVARRDKARRTGPRRRGAGVAPSGLFGAAAREHRLHRSPPVSALHRQVLDLLNVQESAYQAERTPGL